MTESLLSIDIGDGRHVSAIKTDAEQDGGWTFIYAPGAGSNLKDPFGAFLATQLAAAGVTLIRFQFPYSEAGRSAPDRPAVLESTWRAAIEASGAGSRRLAVGGRSMGGRIASQVVAAGAGVEQLTLFAYPLHPPGHPEQARVEHLARINMPTLFCSGTRDAFGAPEELSAAAARVPRASVHFLQGADHGFNVLRSTGRTRQDIWAEATQALQEFLAET